MAGPCGCAVSGGPRAAGHTFRFAHNRSKAEGGARKTAREEKQPPETELHETKEGGQAQRARPRPQAPARDKGLPDQSTKRGKRKGKACGPRGAVWRAPAFNTTKPERVARSAERFK